MNILKKFLLLIKQEKRLFNNSPRLIKKKINDNLLLIGNFRNTFKIKNYFFCLPDKKGYLKLASRVIKNLHNYKNKEPIPYLWKSTLCIQKIELKKFIKIILL